MGGRLANFSMDGDAAEGSRDCYQVGVLRMYGRRLNYLGFMATAIALGLGLRRFPTLAPSWVAEYGPDSLWGMMLYFLFSALAPQFVILRRAPISWATAIGVELSQLYQAEWINRVRQTTLGALVLGSGFVWTDIVCYGVGIFVAAVLDSLILGSPRPSSQP